MLPVRGLLQWACCLALLVTCGAAAAAGEQGQYSCDAISKVPKEQRCSFVQANCPTESVVPYAEWYFCHVAPHNVLLRTMYLVAVCSLLPLAFCLLGDTAEFYIAPIMAHVSQAIPKMRPRFAGVTFVALGNGAPDLSANIAAISAGEVVLSAGAFTGAAMFVQCVVAAELIALAGDSGIKCGGAMLRDVGVYCLAILSVLLAFSLGTISQAFVGWAIALYICYMIWVFVGDEWHQRGRPKPQFDGNSLKALLNRIASRGALAGAAAAAGGGSLGPRSSSAAGSSRAQAAVGYANGRDDLEESLLPWAVAEDEEAGDGYNDQDDVMNGLRSHSGTSAPPPQFESQLPSPLSPGQMSYYGPAGGSVGSRPGSRAGSFTSQAMQQQRSTELTAAPAGVLRSPHDAAFPAAGRPPSRGRRVSAPTFAGGAAGGSSGGGSAGTDAQHDMHRHASATLPATQAPAGWPQQQQWRAAGSSSSSSDWSSRQQPQGMRHAGMGQPRVMALGRQGYIDPKTYKQLVWADLAEDEEEEARLEREIARQLLAAGRSRPSAGAQGQAATGAYQPPSLSSPAGSLRVQAEPQQQHQEQQQQLPQGMSPASGQASLLSPLGSEGLGSGVPTPASGLPAGWQGDTVAPGGLQSGFSGQLGSQQQQQQQLPVLAEAPAGWQQQQHPATVWEALVPADAWQQLQWQVTLGNSEEWEDAGPVRQLFRKVTFPLLLPAYLGQRLTIPFASAAGYSREWLISSLLCFPLALICYLGLLSLPAVLTACGVGVAAAATGAVLTAWDQPGQLAVQGLGGRAAAVVPAVLAVLAFCMGVVWIDTVATEVVGVITFLAGLASLPSGVMGLTLLAWGNSLGDFFGNRAMAKAGHTSTAITACFAAPLFNMLISLAFGFSSYLHKLGTSAVQVELTPEVRLGCLFLVSYNLAIIVVGRFCGWRLPPWFRHFARVWYALYFTLAVASGFREQQRTS